MSRLTTASLTALALVWAAPGLAQPGSTPPATTATPPATTTPPPATTPPPTTTAPPTTPPDIATPIEIAPVVNQPAQQAAPPPPAPIELSPEVPYPNGLGDPVENFARADNDRDGGGFPWGLLGLLGLLGLIPWIRGTGPKTIYVEREKPRPDEDRPGR
jgi:hypothetical protein